MLDSSSSECTAYMPLSDLDLPLSFSLHFRQMPQLICRLARGCKPSSWDLAATRTFYMRPSGSCGTGQPSTQLPDKRIRPLARHLAYFLFGTSRPSACYLLVPRSDTRPAWRLVFAATLEIRSPCRSSHFSRPDVLLRSLPSLSVGDCISLP